MPNLADETTVKQKRDLFPVRRGGTAGQAQQQQPPYTVPPPQAQGGPLPAPPLMLASAHVPGGVGVTASLAVRCCSYQSNVDVLNAQLWPSGLFGFCGFTRDAAPQGAAPQGSSMA
jgi:hypothetical protein